MAHRRYRARRIFWNPPMPLLFQRDIGSEHRAFTPTAIRKLLINALATTGLTSADGEALRSPLRAPAVGSVPGHQVMRQHPPPAT
jgi:hypothetical protein